MAQFHPPVRPDFLADKLRDAEREVWESFQKLDRHWHVFYSARENSESGRDREIDYILIRFNRIFYCEVKGGIVKVDQRVGAGVTWEHFKRSGEPIQKRVDPKQLWNAKAALNATIRQIAGKTPGELGFLEHDLYIFPHTSRQVTNGADLERGTIHYAFAEDIATLPQRLRQIIESKTGVFIQSEEIDEIIASLDKMVIKGDALPVLKSGMSAMPALSASPGRTRFEPAPTARRYSYASARKPVSWRPGYALKRLLRHRTIWLGAAGLFLLLAYSNVEQTLPAHPSRPSVASTPAASRDPVISTTVPRTEVSRPLPSEAQRKETKPEQPAAEQAETALPTFIPKVALTDVEQALMLARQIDEGVAWRTGNYHGFVTLFEIEGGRCLRHRITRNDLMPIGIGFTRRCH